MMNNNDSLPLLSDCCDLLVFLFTISTCNLPDKQWCDIESAVKVRDFHSARYLPTIHKLKRQQTQSVINLFKGIFWHCPSPRCRNIASAAKKDINDSTTRPNTQVLKMTATCTDAVVVFAIP